MGIIKINRVRIIKERLIYGGITMASKEQLMAVARSCSYYRVEGMHNLLTYPERSCENCLNWDGERCKINVFDNVLTGLDQT